MSDTQYKPLFDLGKVVATPAALDLLGEFSLSFEAFLERHHQGDWGTVSDKDAMANRLAIVQGNRIMSAYELTPEEKIWIITESDRSATTLLTPDEY